MAISSFGRGKSGERDSTSPAAPAPAPMSSNLTAFIDQGSEFEGKLNFKDTVRIDGSFRGEITSENTLLVGETGQIDATIHSQAVVVCGVVTGDIIAGQRVMLHKGARVDGDITTPNIVIEEGAVFNGQISMKTGADGLAPVKDTHSAGEKSESAAATDKGQSSNPSTPGNDRKS
jgi:cytoskeletal protein CcmA (bactofilin family)